MLGVLGVSTLIACGSAKNEAVVRVTLIERTGVRLTALTHVRKPDEIPLQDVLAKVPRRFPRNPSQGCDGPPNLVILLSDGRKWRYGPCSYPKEVVPLRNVLIIEAQRQNFH